MQHRQLFPLGKAYGQAFCNRDEEVAMLVSNIESGKHTLLIAPRRYGKSSLAERAMEKTGLAQARTNFHLCTSEAEVAELVLSHVARLIGQAIGKVEQLIHVIKNYLSYLEPTLTFGDKVANLTLVPKNQKNWAVVISEALLLLDKLLVEKNKQAVFFFDEFQEIANISTAHELEGAFRTAAQESRNLAIIFSGSLRSMLVSMFEDETRPLYKLCRKIKLDRISAVAYEKHIQTIAKKTWSQALAAEVFERIMVLSNRHPYYVNYLCDVIWQQAKHLPNIKVVDTAWAQVIQEEWSDALKELADLPLNQRKILKYIANQAEQAMLARTVATTLELSTSTIASSITSLVNKDYIERNEQDELVILNPLLLAVLKGAAN